MIDEAEWGRAVRTLGEGADVVTACHINPDGDALGSMLGLASYLRRLGKKVWATWGSGVLVVPPQYQWLPGADSLTLHSDVPDRPGVFVALDCGDVERLELLRGKFEAADATINIDHHISNDGFGQINLVDPEIASSSELVYELVRRMGGTPDPAEATCFYTGIVTDTGRFQYSNAKTETLRTAAELREYGVDHEKVAQDVFQSASFVYLHALGLVLGRARLEDGLVWSWLDRDDLKGVGMDETEDFIDVLRSIREADVAVILKQMANRSYKVSMRSRTDEVDVAEVASRFGGGGHRRAAGFNLRGSPEQCIAEIRKHLTR